MAFSPSGTLAYVTNYGNNTVSVINTSTNTVVNTITVGSEPISVAFSPSGALAYVTNYGSGTANVINTSTNTVVNTITVGSSPEGVAVSPSGALAYVANFGSGTVSAINTATNTVNIITVGSEPYGVAFSPSGALAYVTNHGGDTVSVIDTATNTVVNTITVGTNPYGVAFSPSGALAYVTNSGKNTVSVIDTSTNTIVNTITVGSGPDDVAFSPSGTLAYVINQNSDTANVIDTSTNTIVDTVTVGSGPVGVAFNPSGTLAYVTNFGGITTSVIDPAETSMQNLPSSNALTVSIDAVSSNTIALTFNGVESQFSTGGSTIYGAWTFYGYAQDSTTGLAGIAGLTGTNTITSNNTLTIDPAPTATSLSPSNTTIDLGQYETYNVLISGGAPTFTANLIYVSGPSGATVDGLGTGNVIKSLTNQQDGTVTFTSFNDLSASGSYTFNVVATDSASTPVTFNAVANSITVYPAPTATSLTPSNTSINSGQYVSYNVIINGGTLPITANLVLVSNSLPLQIDGVNAIPGTTYNTIVLGAGSAEPNTITLNSLELNTTSTSGGDVIFTVNAVDGAKTPVAFNSTSNTIIINAVVAQHNSGGGGPAKYTFILSSNINSTLASAQSVYTVYTNNGSISYYQNQLPITLSLLTPSLNVSWACNVSIGASTYAYQNDVYGLGFGIPCGKYYTTYTSNLKSIYSLSVPTKINTTTTSTTTIVTSTLKTTATTTAPITTSVATTTVAQTTVAAVNSSLLKQSQTVDRISYMLESPIYLSLAILVILIIAFLIFVAKRRKKKERDAL